MSRNVAWGVAIGATFLLSITGCAQQPGQSGQPGQLGQAGPANVCALLAAPVTAQLVRSGITASPVKDSGPSTCRWQDQTGATTVTLTRVVGAEPTKDGETKDVPGLGKVNIVGPGEVRFTAGGGAWGLKVESGRPDDVDTETATGVCTAIGAALGGGTSQAGAGQAGAATGNQQEDFTITVIDNGRFRTDLRSSTVRVGGQDSIELESGKAVPLQKVARIHFLGGDMTTVDLEIVLTDGSKLTGKMSKQDDFTGGSDGGSYSQPVRRLYDAQFRRDAPFVTAPLPDLMPWEAATVTVVDKTGVATTVKAPSLRFEWSPTLTLETGQSIPLQAIRQIVVAPPGPDGGPAPVDVTLTTGNTVSGLLDEGTSFAGDADQGAVKILTKDLKSITVERGIVGR